MNLVADPNEPVPEYLADLVRTVRAAVPPLVADMARFGEEMRALVAPSVEAIRSVQQAVALALPPSGAIVELLEKIREGSRWVHEAPKTLQMALAGRTVIHQELSFQDIAAIVRAFDASGVEAAVSKVQERHEELLADAAFRQHFHARWDCEGRGSIMKDVLAAYDAGLHYVAIPAAIAQAEGVVAQFFGLAGLRNKPFQEHVAKLHEGEIFEPLVTSFLESLLVPFVHGQPVPHLNRHAVLHGGDKTYGTQPNAVTAIIWADYILGVTIEAKEKRDATRLLGTDDPDASEP